MPRILRSLPTEPGHQAKEWLNTAIPRRCRAEGPVKTRGDSGVREEHGMRGVRGVRVGALLVGLALVAAACGGGGDDSGDTGTGGGGGTTESKKVGVVYDIGGRGDKS